MKFLKMISAAIALNILIFCPEMLLAYAPETPQSVLFKLAGTTEAGTEAGTIATYIATLFIPVINVVAVLVVVILGKITL